MYTHCIPPTSIFIYSINVLTASMVMWSLFTGLIASSDTFWEVAVLRAGQGIFMAVCAPYATSILADYFPPQYRATAFGIFNIGIYVGYGLALSVGTYLENQFAWELVYIIFGSIGILFAIGMWFSIEEPARAYPNRHSDETYRTKARRALAQAYVVLKYMAGTSSIRIICLAAGLRNAGTYSFSNYMPLFYSPLYQSADRDFRPSTCAWSQPCIDSIVFPEQPVECSPEDQLLLDCCTPGTFTDRNCSAVTPCPTDVCFDVDSKDVWCIDETCQHLSSAPWRNKGMTSYRFSSFMGWIPLVAGSSGAILGGYVSDQIVRKQGPIGRVTVLCGSNFIAAPFLVGALMLDFPWCFFSLIPAYVFGEMWIGVTIALLVDLTPKGMVATSVAIALFVVTLIGGNLVIGVPEIREAYAGVNTELNFVAALPYGANETLQTAFTVSQDSSIGLQNALLWLGPAVYLFSSVLFLLALSHMNDDIEKARRYGVPKAEQAAMLFSGLPDDQPLLYVDLDSDSNRGDDDGSFAKR
jgi:MFS family permease